MAESREEVGKAFDCFLAAYSPKYPKAAGYLAKDRDRCWPSTTSRPSIGSTCAPPTRWNRPSPP